MSLGNTRRFALSASWVIPVEPEGTVLKDHTVVVEQDRILEVLPSRQLSERYPDIDVQDMPGHVLLPGLINMHAHSAMALMRGLADDLQLSVWLNDHIWPAEQRWMGSEYVHDGTQLAILEYLRGGITLYNDSYFFPDVTAAVTSQSGMRACVGLPVISFPTAWAQNVDEYIGRGLEVHQSLKGDPLVSTAFAPHAPYTVDDETFLRIRKLAEEMDVPIHLHLLETAGEIADSERDHGLKPLARLQKLNLLDTRLLAVHMTALSDSDIEVVARHGVNVVHCPESNMKLASGFCPVAKLLDAGVNVCIGTDGAASNNDLDLLGEIRTAALLAKGYSNNPEAVPAATALSMMTINAAKALGMEDQLGSLLPGKQADICAVDLSAPETQPIHNVISHLIYATSRQQVQNVWVAGRQLLKNREPLTLDVDEIVSNARAWQKRVNIDYAAQA